MASDGSLLFDTGLDNSGFSKGIAGLKTAAVAAAAAITAAFSTAAAAAINVGTSYTTAMSQVSATMGITRASEDYSLLAASAEEMGAKTKYSATQAGEALNYLALAGYNAEKAVSALPTVLNVAAAGGIDLAYSSDMITDSMSALGLGMDELEGFADKLAKTSQKSNTSISQLGEAILTVGGTAKTLSGGVTELNTMLGLIADNGIKGAEGGTALRNIILSLSAPTDTAAAAMERLNISAFDGSGKMRALSDVFADFNTALAPLTNQQKTQALNEIFNKVDLKAVNALLGTSSERFGELAGQIENSTGAAEEMAKTMSDNLQGDMDAFNSALEGLGITAFNKFEQPMRTAVQSVTADISAMIEQLKDGELSESLDNVSASVGQLITAVGKLAAEDLLPAVINGMQFIIKYGNIIISVMAGIGAAVAAINLAPVVLKMVAVFQEANLQVALLAGQFGAAQVSAVALGGGLSLSEILVSLFTGKITLATAATSAFNTVLKANPIFLVASVIGVAVSALGIFITQVNKSKNAVEEAAEETNEYAEAMNKVKEAGQDNIDKTNSEIGVIREKGKRYEELRQRLNYLTRGEMAEFKDLCTELQQILPEGTDIINEQTGAYNDLADSIDNVCRSMEKNAVLNYKYKEYEEAAGQNYDLEKQIQRAEQWAKDNQHLINSVDPNSDINLFSEYEFGISYSDMIKTRDENQRIIDEYYQLYSDTYNELHAAETSYYDTSAEQHRLAATEYANKIIEENNKALKRTERETKKLEDGFRELDHLYATGEISDEKELYNNKLALWNEYGNKSNQDHWQYYEELYSYEKKFAEESEQKEKERLEKLKELNEETAEALLDAEKDRYKKQLSITTSGINSLLSEYKKSMSELENNISSYKAKLLSVGDIFAVTEYTDENGKKIRKYTVENLQEQMDQMQKYHDYVKQLKASGASEGLLSELTSMDFADGAQFGKYLTSMSSAEFAQINELYKKRDELAGELSKDLYAGEAEKINTAMLSAVDKALLQLPEQAQAAGRQFLSDFVSGLDLSTEDISNEISNFVSGFTEVYNSSLEDLDLEHKFSVTLGGMNTYSIGQNLARDLAAGFNSEIEKSIAEIKLGQVNAGIQFGGASNASTSSAGSGNTTETIVFENTNHITVEIDNEKLSEKTEKRITEKQRRTG